MSAGFGFGSKPAQSSTLFGQSTSTTGGTTSFGFGQTANPGQTAAGSTQASKPLFGATTPSVQTGSSGFSLSSTSAFGAQPASSQSAFGTNTALKPKSTSGASTLSFGSGFGASSFGATSQSTSSFGGSMFGSQAKPTSLFGGGAFGSGASATSGFGSSALKQPQFNCDNSIVRKNFEKSGIIKAQSLNMSSLERIVDLQQQLDPGASDYVFKGILYNIVHPTQVKNYAPLPNSQSSEKSNVVNPEPRCMVPIPVSGLDGLSARNKNQIAQINRHQVLIDKLNEKIVSLSEKQKTDVASQIKQLGEVHTQLKNKITELNKELSVLNNQGTSLQPTEENLWRQVKENESKLCSTKQFKILQSKVDSQKKEIQGINDSSTAKINSVKANEFVKILEENSKSCDTLKALLEEELNLARRVHSFKLHNNSSFL